jgi:hypothetical protein
MVELTLQLYNCLGKLYARINRLSNEEQYDRCKKWFLNMTAAEKVCPMEYAVKLMETVIEDRRVSVNLKGASTISDKPNESVDVVLDENIQKTCPPFNPNLTQPVAETPASQQQQLNETTPPKPRARRLQKR